MQPYVQLDEKYLHNTVSTVLCLLNFGERGFLELFSVCAICAFFFVLLSFWMKLSLLVLVHSKGGLLHLRTAAVRLHSPPSPCRVPPRCCFLLTAFCELEIQAIESSTNEIEEKQGSRVLVSLQVPVFWTLTCDRLVIGPLA